MELNFFCGLLQKSQASVIQLGACLQIHSPSPACVGTAPEDVRSGSEGPHPPYQPQTKVNAAREENNNGKPYNLLSFCRGNVREV